MRHGLLIGWILFGCCAALLIGSASAQTPADELIILLSSPAEGEVFYTAASGPRISMPIAGQVVSYHSPLHPESVELALELVDASGNRSRVTVPLDDRGYFQARASMLSRLRPWPSDDPHVEETCGECHRTNVELSLPEDVTQLVVYATTADGRTAQVTRSLHFDYGIVHDLNVTVDGLPDDSQNVQITASTLVYDWRRRIYTSTVDSGQATLAIEVLTHADLTYEISLTPTILNETLYTAPAETIIISGDMETLPPVKLVASPVRGSISGKVVDGVSGKAVSDAALLAVDARTGAAQTVTTSSDGTFMLNDLPVAEHILLARTSDGFHLPQKVNLAETPAAETAIHLTRAGTAVLRGTVVLDGRPLPFAQATVAGLPTAHADPLTGSFELDAAAADGPVEIEIAAAGCYAIKTNSSERDLGEITLTLRNDTQVIKQGGSQLYLPAQSTVNQSGDVYTLKSGVLWVTSTASDPAPFRVQVGVYQLQGTGADFSVENVGGALPRLYVSRGEVLVSRTDAAESLHVTAGQSLMLEGDEIYPVDMTPGVGALLRTQAGSVSRFELAPSPAAQQAAALSRVGTVAAQVFMLLALLISFVFLPVLVAGAGVVYFYQRLRT